MNPQKEQAYYNNRQGVELYRATLFSHQFPWHYHEACTIMMVEEGSMCYYFSNEIYTVKKGEAFVINPHEAHYNKPGNNGCVYKAMFLAMQNEAIAFKRQVLCDALFVNVLQDIYQALAECTDRAGSFSLKLLLENTLTDYIPHTYRQQLAPQKVLPAIQYVNQHLDDKIVIGQLAEACNLSPFHFQRVFKKELKLSVVSYIQQQKLVHGKQLLYNGERIVSTAIDTGYFDQSHFHKAFRKMWATTPLHFTRQHDFTRLPASVL